MCAIGKMNIVKWLSQNVTVIHVKIDMPHATNFGNPGCVGYYFCMCVYLKAALNTPAIKSPGNPGILVAKSITVKGKI
jgi:hypothetical protein